MTFPLQRGSKGAEVRTLQQYLNRFFDQKLVEDADFGPRTEAAVMLVYKGRRSMSKEEYERIRNRLLVSSGPDPKDMEAEELMTFINNQDGDSYKVLKFAEPVLNLMKQKGKTLPHDLKLDLIKAASSFNNRQFKIRNHQGLKSQRKTIQALESIGLSGISGVPIIWLVVVGVVAAMAAVIVLEFRKDGYDSIKDRQSLKDIETRLCQIAPNECAEVMGMIQKADKEAYKKGKADGFFSFGKIGTPVVLLLGALVVLK